MASTTVEPKLHAAGGAQAIRGAPPTQAGLERLQDLFRDCFGLTMRAQRRMEGVVLTVTDHRCQMPELCIGHVWEPDLSGRLIAEWALRCKQRIETYREARELLRRGPAWFRERIDAGLPELHR